jgi:hypothetical protein
MKKGVGMANDLLVSLPDVPGEGAKLGEALGNAGVNIEGMCAVTHEGRGIVHILVEDVAGARAALEGAGIKVEGETVVIVGELPSESVDSPGTMGRMMRSIADAGINVSFAYLATKDRVVTATSDNDKVRELMAQM